MALIDKLEAVGKEKDAIFDRAMELLDSARATITTLEARVEELEEHWHEQAALKFKFFNRSNRYRTALEEIAKNTERCSLWPYGIEHDIPCNHEDDDYRCSWCIATTATGEDK
jgi:chromosome segregation ATPase